MARNRREKRFSPQEKQESAYDRARNELFSAIRQCGVIDAHQEDQVVWMDETIQFLGERYPELTGAEQQQLREMGMRFCQPVIPHGTQPSAASLEDANAA